MSQPPNPPFSRLGYASGGWSLPMPMVGNEQGDGVPMGWFENAGVSGLRRRVIPPPGGSGLPASNPFPNMPSATMDSESSFTSLVTGGFNSDVLSTNIQPANQIPASVEGPSTVKGNQKRSKNFSVDEDELLVSAWLNVSLDPVQGVNQTRSTYWNRIYEYFHGNKTFISDRSEVSLMNRWSGIQHDVNLFAGCVSKIEDRNQSGKSIADKQADALKLFKSDDEKHRNFPYMHCWKILKDQPKWTEKRKQLDTQKAMPKKRKNMANSDHAMFAALLPAADNESQPVPRTQERPTRNKKKEKLRRRSNFDALDYILAKKKEADAEKELKKELEERCNKAFALEEEKIKLEKQKFEFERDMQEERIMRVDLSTLSANQQEYYITLQQKILARRLDD